MQIQLKQQHIEAAVRAYVAKAGIQFPVEEINFTAGRGKDGLTATIEMEDPFLADVPEPVRTSKPKPAATRTMEARGNENAMPSEPAEEPVPEAETPDPEPEAKTEEPPFVPDETQEEEAFQAPEPETKAPEKKKAASLFS